MKLLIKSLQNLFSSDNEFIAMARSGKRITHMAVAIPLFIVFIFGALIISMIFGQFLVDTIEFSNVFIGFYNLFISFGLVTVVVWFWVHFYEKRSILSLGLVKKNALKFYLKGFIVGFVTLTVVVILIAAVGGISFHKNPEPISSNLIGIMFIMLLGYIVQGASEEILARGWQFQVIGAQHKPWLGAVVSSVMFTMIHLINTGISVIVIINLVLFSFFLIFFILYEKNIWVACGWHTSWNWAMENIYGLNVSGSEGLGSVLKLNIVGPDYITGGNFGPEGSIFTTFVLIGSMIIILIRNAKKQSL